MLAALGDAPTAAIAVVAILLGLLLAARGPRDKRAAASDDGEDRAPMMLTVPVARAPETDPGFVGPEGEIVGHGLIRLGSVGPVGGEGSPVPAHVEPAPAPVAPEPAVAEPVAVAPALPQAAPSAAPAPEAPFFEQPPSIPEPPAGAAPWQPAPPAEIAPPASAPAAPPAEEPAGDREPAWRIAARAANDAVHFRQGTIKVGGKPVDKRRDP